MKQKFNRHSFTYIRTQQNKNNHSEINAKYKNKNEQKFG